jgi:methyl-accepting chemotaxis protein
MDTIVSLVLAPIGLFSGKPLAVGIALGLLGVSAALYLYLTLVGARRFKRAFGGLARELKQSRGAGGTQEDQLARADELFEQSALASAWRQYRASVHFNDGHVFAYSDPAAFFTADRMPGYGYVKWYSTLGGVFLTLGLFFTFVGLSAALLQVAGSGEGGSMDPTQLRHAVEGILAVSSVKFITSLAGILAYILWSLAARHAASAQDKLVERLVSEIRQLSTYVAPEAVLKDLLRASVEQSEQFKTFGNDLAVAIGHQIQVALKSQFEALPGEVGNSVGRAVMEGMAPLKEEMSTIAAQIGRTGGDLAHGAGDAFNRVFSEGFGGQMSKFGEMMDRTIGALEGLPEKVRQTENGLGGEIGKAAERLAETALRMNSSMDRQQQVMAETMQALTQRLSAIPETVETASQGAMAAIGDTVRETIKVANAAAGEASRAGSERLSTEVGAIAASLAASADVLRSAAADSATSFKTAIETAGAGAADASRRGAERLSSEVNAMAASLATSAESLRSAGVESAQGLKTAREELAAGVSDGVRAVADTAAAATDKLNSTLTTLNSIVSGLSARVEESATAMATQNGHLTRAGEVLSGASGSLVRAAGAVEEAASPLPTAMRGVTEAIQLVSSATERMHAASSANERIATSLTATANSAERAFGEQADRLADLQPGVKGTLNELLQGVSSLGSEISKCIETYDREIANSITSLETAVLDFTDMASDRRPTVAAGGRT